MSKPHGTASEGRVLEFALTVARNAPRDLPSEIMDAWDGNGEEMKRRLSDALASGPSIEEPPKVEELVEPFIPSYPANGVEFELTLEGDAVDSMEMVKSQSVWKYRGKRVKGIHTRRFKLVSIGDCPDLDEVRKKLAAHGEIPEGQWRVPFKAAFKSDANGPVGIADPSWASLCRDAYNNRVFHVHFPFVWGDASSYIENFNLGVSWRWLVEVRNLAPKA